jgi:hypothetical protein
MSQDQAKRISRGAFIVEVLPGGSGRPFWYYMVRRIDSRELVDLAKFDSYEAACIAAEKALDDVNRRAGQAAAASGGGNQKIQNQKRAE